jgi:hypothetical protein
MPYRNTLALIALALAAVTPIAAADLAGKWKAEFETAIGVQKYVYEFKVDGAVITGQATFEREMGKGSVTLREIKLAGDDVSFVEPFEFEGNAIRIEYKGKITGDEMKLLRQVGEFATEDVVAKRVKAEPPAPPSPKP